MGPLRAGRLLRAGRPARRLDEPVKKFMLSQICKRLTPTAIKIRADIEVTCFHYEGITAIKRALLKGMALGSEELPIKIKLVAPPLYVMLCSTLDKASGLKLLNEAIDVMQTEIKAAKGELQVRHVMAAAAAQPAPAPLYLPLGPHRRQLHTVCTLQAINLRCLSLTGQGGSARRRRT